LDTSKNTLLTVASHFKNYEYDADLQLFLAHRPIRNIARRNIAFANLVKSWGFKSKFLFSFNDADGYCYSMTDTSQPAIQYCRLKEQRDSVILFPLPKEYHGFGGANIPNIVDDKPFDQKKDQLVWRGVTSGVYIRNNVKHSTPQIPDSYFPLDEFNKFRRLKVVKDLFNVSWADVGFVKKEQAHMESLHRWMESNDLGLFQSVLTIEEQLCNKFLLALDGNDIPSNLFWGLRSNSVVFKGDSRWETALCAGLKPWVHYVPVENCADDISKKFETMLTQPELCEKIINNAHRYMENFVDSQLRTALDYLTLKKYVDNTIPLHDISNEVPPFSVPGL